MEDSPMDGYPRSNCPIGDCPTGDCLMGDYLVGDYPVGGGRLAGHGPERRLGHGVCVGCSYLRIDQGGN